MSKKQLSEDEKVDRIISFCMRGAFIAALVVVLSYLFNFGVSWSAEQSTWGEFGDFVGGVLNPALGFLTLMVLLKTIDLQRKELKATREELSRSATAQEAAKNVLDKQAELQSRQQFESTFFSLLELHNTAYERFSRVTSPGVGGSELNYLTSIISDCNNLGEARNKLSAHLVVADYYFDTLTQVLNFLYLSLVSRKIDVSLGGLDAQSVHFYSGLLMAGVGGVALRVLAVRCALDERDGSYSDLYHYVTHFSLLEKMPYHLGDEGKVIGEAVKRFQPEAFGESPKWFSGLNKYGVNHTPA